MALYNNQFTGSIQPEIGNLTNLFYLSLSNNRLTGELPESICDFIARAELTLHGNQFCPPYPSCLEDYPLWVMYRLGYQDTSDCD